MSAQHEWTCSHCGEITADSDLTESTSTWQQWQCLECGSWEDKKRPLCAVDGTGHWSPEMHIREALRLLMAARDHMKRAKAPKATAKIRAAITSTQGAQRHAAGMASRLASPDHLPKRGVYAYEVRNG